MSGSSPFFIVFKISIGSKSDVINIFFDLKFFAILSDKVVLPVPGLPDINIRQFLVDNNAKVITVFACSSPIIKVSRYSLTFI